jgi:hypothetical protein
MICKNQANAFDQQGDSKQRGRLRTLAPFFFLNGYLGGSMSTHRNL